MQNSPKSSSNYGRQWRMGTTTRQGTTKQDAKKRGEQCPYHHKLNCAKHNIAHLTLYAFSTENWNRPKTEVDFLMKLLERCCAMKQRPTTIMELDSARLRGYCVFSEPLKHLILDLESATSHYTTLTQTLAPKLRLTQWDRKSLPQDSTSQRVWS